jgi:hypothetical protein
MTLIGLIVMLIVLGVVFWAARSIMAAFAIPAQIQVVVTVLLVLIALVVVLQAFGLSTGLGSFRLTN